MLKNQKGITLVALAITVLLMIIILGTIKYSSTSSLNIKQVKNMYNDIRILEDKIAIYYLNYDKIPVKGDAKTASELWSDSNTPTYNPNDNENYFEIDISKLKNITLNNIKEKYIINEQSHTIYYLKGVESEGKVYYTTPVGYTNVELTSESV